MPPQKHLKDLLLVDQEPFHLPTFIADRCRRLKKLPLPPPPSPPKPQAHQHLTKPNSNLFPRNLDFCSNPCFFFSSSAHSSHETPIPPPISSSVGSSRAPNGLFLHVPAKTSALLLEAAMRVQKLGSNSRNTNPGFGLLRSVLRRLKIRSRRRYHRLRIGENGVGKAEAAGTGACGGRLTQVCSGKEESVNLDSSSRSRGIRREDDDGHGLLFEEVESVKLGREGVEFEYCLSPSRFVLQSAAGDSPDRRSPATSPPRWGTLEETSSCAQESTVRSQVEGYKEDKDQNSPVSVLEPPFKDDDGHGHGAKEEDHHEKRISGGDELECRSYAFVQRSKKLLKELHRFEKLAELDPLELEKRFVVHTEQGDDDDESIGLEEKVEEEESRATLLKYVSCQSGYHNVQKPGVKRLISHLIKEEEERVRRTVKRLDGGIEAVVKRVCRRLEAWETVKTSTIELMVSMELRSESHDMRKLPDQVAQVALDIEVDILVVLVEEMVEDISIELMV